LSPNEVDECFTDDFMSTLPADCTAIHVIDYVFLNYINTDSAMFPPEIWAEFSSSTLRTTTNACESFHAKLNGMFYRSHPNIYIN